MELRLVEPVPADSGGEVSLHFEVALKVAGFSGYGAFLVREGVVLEFARELEDVVGRRLPTAKLECGLVAGLSDVVFFACQVECAGGEDAIVVHATLGTAGPNGLLQRLHVALQPTAESLSEFERDLLRMVQGRQGQAVVRQGASMT